MQTNVWSEKNGTKAIRDERNWYELNGPRQQTNIVNEAKSDEAGYLFVATYLGISKKELSCIVNSRCSNYMSFNKE